MSETVYSPVPDTSTYYKAVVLSRVVEWGTEKNDKKWVSIEKTLSKSQLGSIIWNPPQYRRLDENTDTLTHNVFKIWDGIYKRLNGKYNSPLITLLDNEYFPPGLKNIGGVWLKKGVTQLRDIIKKGKMIPTQDLMHNNLALGMVEWRSLQLNHFIKNLPQPIRSGEDLTTFERLFVEKGPEKYYI